MAEGGNSTYEILLTASDKTREAFDSAKENTGSLTDKLDIMRGAFAATAVASAAAIAVMVKGSINAADEMSKAAQKVGTTTEMLSGLKYAADLSDVSFEALQKSLGKLANNAYTAATSGGAAATAFKTLGIDVKGADGHLKDSGAMLEEVAGKFAKMPDSAEKSALAIQLFGKAGLDMIPLLNSGSEGLAQMRDEAQKLGIIIDGDVAKQAEAFNDNLTRIGKRTEGLSNKIMADLVPALNVLTQAYVDATKDANSFSGASTVIKTIFETLAVVGVNTAYVFKAVGTEIGGIAAQIDALAHGDLDGFRRIGAIMKEDAAAARKDIDELSDRILNPPKAEKTDAPGGAKPDLNAEANQKALEAMLAKAKQFSDELVIAHESAFDKIVAKYLEMDASLSAAGEAGNAQRKALYQSFEAFVRDESDKRTAEIEAAAEKEKLANDKIIETQQEKLTKMQEQADQASATGEERENLRFLAQVRELDKDRKVLEDKKLFDIESQRKYDLAMEALQRDHLNRMSITSRTFGVSMMQFEKMNNLQKTQNFASALMQMTAIGAQNNRELFEINKVASIANATISGFQAVQDSFAFGAKWGGPIGGGAMAAIAIAATVANIAAIASTTFGAGGASSGGAGVPSMATSPGIPVAPQQEAPTVQLAEQATVESEAVAAKSVRTVNIVMSGEAQLFTAQSIRDQLIPALNDAISDGVIINVSNA